MTLALSSIGELYPVIDEFNKSRKSKKTIEIISAVNKNEAKGLLLLANSTPDDTWCASLYFWKDFASFYVKTLCHMTKQKFSNALPLAVNSKYITELTHRVPDILGNEFCDSKNLAKIWQIMNDYVIEALKKQDINTFFINHLPNWQKVGCVCFHLAENKQNEQYPFAFMVTIVSHLNNQANLVYSPLKLAIQHTNKLDMLQLLHPIYNIAKKFNWVKKLLETKEIYQASRWTVQQAYALLKDSEEIKNNGIIVILPDWWKKNNKPKVQFSIGSQTKNTLELQTILNCDINLIHNNKPLTSSETEILLHAENNLVPFRGGWIEVGTDQLQKVMEQWNKLKKNAITGVSFIEGMRMLAGFNTEHSGNNKQFNENETSSWSSYVAGPWLADTLSKLRDPSLLQQHIPKKLTTTKLRPYQQLGVNWLYFLTNLGIGACLADDMGLGKSIQIIALLLLTKESLKKEKKCSLLVLPASLLSNWKNELNKFAPSLTACFFHPSETSAQTLAQITTTPSKLQQYDLVLTTYATLWRQTWLLDQNWDKVILDEAQAIKNPTSKQTRAIKELKSNVRIALTGTPIENCLVDLWSLFDFLLPGLLGSYNTFKGIIKKLEAKQEDNNKIVNYGAISKLIQPYILRRLKTDKKIITDLPEKTEVNTYCGLTNLQARLYKKTIKELTTALNDSNMPAIKRKGLVLNYLLKFKQICNHPAQLLANGNYSPTQSGKFLRLKDLCEEIKQKQEKVLIFTQFKTITRPLALFLATVFGVTGLIINGTTAVKKRQQIVDTFQDKAGPPFMVLSLKAGGTGLNLTTASHVIHFDRWWNPAVENQATDRAFRIGQKANVLVHKFICSGTIEDNINTLLNQKTKLANEILVSNNKTPTLTELTNQEILQLVSLDVNKIQI